MEKSAAAACASAGAEIPLRRRGKLRVCARTGRPQERKERSHGQKADRSLQEHAGWAIHPLPGVSEWEVDAPVPGNQGGGGVALLPEVQAGKCRGYQRWRPGSCDPAAHLLDQKAGKTSLLRGRNEGKAAEAWVHGRLCACLRGSLRPSPGEKSFHDMPWIPRFPRRARFFPHAKTGTPCPNWAQHRRFGKENSPLFFPLRRVFRGSKRGHGNPRKRRKIST